MQKISVVVPVYQAESCLRQLYNRLKSALEKICDDFEIILIDDSSKDRSWDIILELASLNKHVKGIQLSRNFGQHNALLCGIRVARYDIIITLDDDLQNPPEEISKLTNKLAEGYDVVYGTPQKKQYSFWRNIATQITKIVLQKAMGIEAARNVSTFRAFKAYLRENFAAYQGPFVSIDVLLSWGAANFAVVPVQHDECSSAKSTYNLHKLILHTLNMLTGFSTLPLQLASLTGFIFMLFGVGVFIYVISRYFLQGNPVPGFPFLASIIAIFSGVQLFALGIIGEYLARIYFRTIQKPSYTIRSKT